MMGKLCVALWWLFVALWDNRNCVTYWLFLAQKVIFCLSWLSRAILMKSAYNLSMSDTTALVSAWGFLKTAFVKDVWASFLNTFDEAHYPSERKWHNRGCVILQTFCQMMCWICRQLFLEHFGELWFHLEVRWHNRNCVILHDMEEVTLYFCFPYPPRLLGEFLWDMGRWYG